MDVLSHEQCHPAFVRDPREERVFSGRRYVVSKPGRPMARWKASGSSRVMSDRLTEDDPSPWGQLPVFEDPGILVEVSSQIETGQYLRPPLQFNSYYLTRTGISVYGTMGHTGFVHILITPHPHHPPRMQNRAWNLRCVSAPIRARCLRQSYGWVALC